ncbi:hypothetical protein C0081_01195 [Cohaesibacter celericrescens]|uniref:Uncharacterized protein n=1 Tax=Cohaesibacter celericrescens TaxID=2067669 RepID=A0A2N5XWJ7_9HYPH|nr:hypothetical protein C0081_19235 [Cohaesibacter celericrescens]PLW78886.1 hypothetical protein C0081_01195 [Cohaesibacter celericrescens]
MQQLRKLLLCQLIKFLDQPLKQQKPKMFEQGLKDDKAKVKSKQGFNASVKRKNQISPIAR